MWVWTKPLRWLRNSVAPLCYDRENPNMRLLMIVLSLNFLHGLLPGRKKKLSLNLAISNNASLTSRGHWSSDHVTSQRIIHRQIKFVAFALVPVFLHFRWTQKWLQGIQGPCGSFRKFRPCTFFLCFSLGSDTKLYAGGRKIQTGPQK